VACIDQCLFQLLNAINGSFEEFSDLTFTKRFIVEISQFLAGLLQFKCHSDRPAACQNLPGTVVHSLENRSSDISGEVQAVDTLAHALSGDRERNGPGWPKVNQPEKETDCQEDGQVYPGTALLI
jgi:hypothetical protein